MSGRVRGQRRSQDDRAEPVRRWWPIADALVLGALVTVAAVLLVPVYGSAAPVVAAGAGAAVAMGAVLAVRGWALPTLLAPALALVGVALMGAVVVGPDGVGAVLRGAIDGWRNMLTIATPIGVSGGLLMPPLLVGAGCALLAGVLSTSRRAELAPAGPMLAFGLCAAFGDARLAATTTAVLAATAVGGTVGWLSWRSARAARARAGTLYGSRAVAVRQLLVGVTVLGLAVAGAAVVSAATASDRIALRTAVDVPLDPSTFTSALGEFRRYTKDLADEPVLEVRGLPDGGRLRLAALDAYDGVQFAVSDEAGPFVRIGPRRSAGAPRAVADTVQVSVLSDVGPYLPVPGDLTAVTFAGGRATELTDALRYSAAASTGLLPGGLRPGDAYTVSGVPVGTADTATAAASASARPAAVPFPSTAPLPDLIRAAASRYVTGVDGAFAQVEAIRTGLAADGFFSHGRPDEPRSAAGHGLDRMSLMLTASPMMGDQEQYAALMTLLVRSIGLPARAVVGFAPPPAPAGSGAGDGVVTVRGSDITAWVEVPFDGLGWVAFDPTPDPDKPASAAEPPAASERRPVGVEVPPALPQADPDSLAAENAAQQPQDDADQDGAAAAGPSGLALALWIVAGVLALVVLLAIPALVILVLKAVRRRRRRRAATVAAQITGGWQELLDAAVDAGYRPAPGQTRAEVAAAADAALGVQLAELTPEADAADFGGPVAFDPAQAYRYWSRVQDRSSAVLGALGARRRWRARLSTASLRSGGRR